MTSSGTTETYVLTPRRILPGFHNYVQSYGPPGSIFFKDLPTPFASSLPISNGQQQKKSTKLRFAFRDSHGYNMYEFLPSDLSSAFSFKDSQKVTPGLAWLSPLETLHDVDLCPNEYRATWIPKTTRLVLYGIPRSLRESEIIDLLKQTVACSYYPPNVTIKSFKLLFGDDLICLNPLGNTGDSYNSDTSNDASTLLPSCFLQSNCEMTHQYSKEQHYNLKHTYLHVLALIEFENEEQARSFWSLCMAGALRIYGHVLGAIPDPSGYRIFAEAVAANFRRTDLQSLQTCPWCQCRSSTITHEQTAEQSEEEDTKHQPNNSFLKNETTTQPHPLCFQVFLPCVSKKFVMNVLCKIPILKNHIKWIQECSGALIFFPSLKMRDKFCMSHRYTFRASPSLYVNSGSFRLLHKITPCVFDPPSLPLFPSYSETAVDDTLPSPTSSALEGSQGSSSLGGGSPAPTADTFHNNVLISQSFKRFSRSEEEDEEDYNTALHNLENDIADPNALPGSSTSPAILKRWIVASKKRPKTTVSETSALTGMMTNHIKPTFVRGCSSLVENQVALSSLKTKVVSAQEKRKLELLSDQDNLLHKQDSSGGITSEMLLLELKNNKHFKKNPSTTVYATTKPASNDNDKSLIQDKQKRLVSQTSKKKKKKKKKNILGTSSTIHNLQPVPFTSTINSSCFFPDNSTDIQQQKAFMPSNKQPTVVALGDIQLKQSLHQQQESLTEHKVVRRPSTRSTSAALARQQKQVIIAPPPPPPPLPVPPPPSSFHESTTVNECGVPLNTHVSDINISMNNNNPTPITTTDAQLPSTTIPQPPPVKRGRGRPKGSTKRKLETL